MSVLIKGLEIPKSCYDCQFNKGCNTRWFLRNDRRPYDCPLVEVPTPHGRLIDMDNINRITLEDSCYELTHIKGDEIICEIDAPIVIEAERKNK